MRLPRLTADAVRLAMKKRGKVASLLAMKKAKSFAMSIAHPSSQNPSFPLI
jgi:hypothetical protein